MCPLLTVALYIQVKIICTRTWKNNVALYRLIGYVEVPFMASFDCNE